MVCCHAEPFHLVIYTFIRYTSIPLIVAITVAAIVAAAAAASLEAKCRTRCHGKYIASGSVGLWAQCEFVTHGVPRRHSQYTHTWQNAYEYLSSSFHRGTGHSQACPSRWTRSERCKNIRRSRVYTYSTRPTRCTAAVPCIHTYRGRQWMDCLKHILVFRLIIFTCTSIYYGNILFWISVRCKARFFF